MQGFTYQAAPMRVIFGAGTLGQLASELARHRDRAGEIKT